LNLPYIIWLAGGGVNVQSPSFRTKKGKKMGGGGGGGAVGKPLGIGWPPYSLVLPPVKGEGLTGKTFQRLEGKKN